jgi:nuclear transcription factor Y alpha
MNPQMIHAYSNQYRLPNSEVQVEEEPIYVNAKQYHRILVRREQRAKLERQNKLVKQRKPFLHVSRHNHAKGRKRGPNGRFMNKKEKEKYENELALGGGSTNTSITENGGNSQNNSATNTPDNKSEKKKRGRKKGSKPTMDQAVEATVSQLQEQTQTPHKETPQK